MKKYFVPSAQITAVSTKDVIQSSQMTVYEEFVGDVSAAMPEFWEGLL
jgi:hypothetical protein